MGASCFSKDNSLKDGPKRKSTLDKDKKQVDSTSPKKDNDSPKGLEDKSQENNIGGGDNTSHLFFKKPSDKPNPNQNLSGFNPAIKRNLTLFKPKKDSTFSRRSSLVEKSLFFQESAPLNPLGEHLISTGMDFEKDDNLNVNNNKNKLHSRSSSNGIPLPLIKINDAFQPPQSNKHNTPLSALMPKTYQIMFRKERKNSLITITHSHTNSAELQNKKDDENSEYDMSNQLDNSRNISRKESMCFQNCSNEVVGKSSSFSKRNSLFINKDYKGSLSIRTNEEKGDETPGQIKLRKSLFMSPANQSRIDFVKEAEIKSSSPRKRLLSKGKIKIFATNLEPLFPNIEKNSTIKFVPKDKKSYNFAKRNSITIIKQRVHDLSKSPNL